MRVGIQRGATEAEERVGDRTDTMETVVEHDEQYSSQCLQYLSYGPQRDSISRIIYIA